MGNKVDAVTKTRGDKDRCLKRNGSNLDLTRPDQIFNLYRAEIDEEALKLLSLDHSRG